MLLHALRSLFADVDWQASPTAAVLAEAVADTAWTQLGTHHIGRDLDGLPCRVLRDSALEALVATVQMPQPWAFVFGGESTPFRGDLGPSESALPELIGYRFDAPEPFLRGLAGDPQVFLLLDALREDRVGVEMREGRVVLRQQHVHTEEAPLLGEAAIALATALRDAWDRLVEAPLRDEGLAWDGQRWTVQSRHAEVEVEPGRRLALRARFPTRLPDQACLRPRRRDESPAALPGLLGHRLSGEGDVPVELFDDPEVEDALLLLLSDPGSRLDAHGLEAHFRPWPLGAALTERFDALDIVHEALRAAG